jgi:hypothetical protein
MEMKNGAAIAALAIETEKASIAEPRKGQAPPQWQ